MSKYELPERLYHGLTIDQFLEHWTAGAIRGLSKHHLDAGNRTKAYQAGWSTTNSKGQWNWSIWLDTGKYKLIVDSPGIEVKYPTEFEVT